MLELLQGEPKGGNIERIVREPRKINAEVVYSQVLTLLATRGLTISELSMSVPQLLLYHEAVPELTLNPPVCSQSQSVTKLRTSLRLMIEIPYHLIYIYVYMYYTTRIPTLVVYEVYITSCKIPIINSKLRRLEEVRHALVLSFLQALVVRGWSCSNFPASAAMRLATLPIASKKA